MKSNIIVYQIELIKLDLITSSIKLFCGIPCSKNVGFSGFPNAAHSTLFCNLMSISGSLIVWFNTALDDIRIDVIALIIFPVSPLATHKANSTEQLMALQFFFSSLSSDDFCGLAVFQVAKSSNKSYRD